MARPVLERMAEAIALLKERQGGRRWPKAFYLGSDDWSDFMATNPPTGPTIWNGGPTTEPVFDGVPVRESINTAPRRSRLYNSAGSACELPQ